MEAKNKLIQMKDAWEHRDRKLCEAGEKVYALRLERQRLVEERDRLREQREAEALQAAGA
jgi:hypothetical protein